MGRAFLILILSASVLAGCGGFSDSRLNPFNWFGRSVSEPADPNATVNPLIPRRKAGSIFRKEQEKAYAGTLVGEVTELLVERRPGGAVIRATGVADRQGPFEVRLTEVEDESTGTTLTYALRAYQIAGPRGAEASRTVTVGLWLSDNDLAGIRTIRVQGQRNTRTSRR